MKHKIVKKKWGFEEWIVNDIYCGKKLFNNGEWSSEGKFHRHKEKDETFYVLQGKLIIEFKDSGQQILLYPGQSLRIRPGRPHRFKGEDDLCTFIEFSTHHEDSDTYYD